MSEDEFMKRPMTPEESKVYFRGGEASRAAAVESLARDIYAQAAMLPAFERDEKTSAKTYAEWAFDVADAFYAVADARKGGAK